jgi:hypothetical protein
MDVASSANVNFMEGMFSASASYRRAQELMANNSNYVAEVTAYFSAFQADLAPYWTVFPSENFLEFVKQLPKTYEENPQKYEELFREYGTHFFTGGCFGGLFRLSITLDKRLQNKMSGKNIRTAINATFFDLLEGIGASSNGIYEVNSEFQSLSQVTARYYGGYVPIEGPAEWDKWSKSVPKHPWLLSGYLSEIKNLIPDGDEKKGAVTLAMETYLAIAYLEDMVINLNYFLKRNNIEKKKGTANKFIKQSESILSKIPVDVSAAKSLALEVKQFLFENQPSPPEMMSEFGIAEIIVISADVPDKRFLPIKPDPFVKVYAAGHCIGVTSAASGTTRPYWNEKFRSSQIHVSSPIR